MKRFGFIALCLIFVFASVSFGQVQLSTVNVSATQNFDGLSTATFNLTDNTSITGVYAFRTLGNATPNVITAGVGSSATGQFYNFGTSLALDRALGSVSSGTPGTLFYGVRYQNNTGVPVTLDVQYTGEQWRNGGNVAAQVLAFNYRQAATVTDLTTGTYTAFTSLDFTTLVNTAVAAALDGNNSANRTVRTASIPVTIPAGQEIMLRWADIDNAGSDHGIGIDDLIVTPRALPTFSINDVSVVEGNAGTAQIVFTVTKSAASAGTTVDWATANGTTDSTDLAAQSGTLTFGAAATTQTITINVNGDTTFEPDDTFFVNLTNAVNATISDAQGIGTITNDDAVPSFAISDVSQSEGNAGTSNYTFTVTKSGATEVVSSVDFITADGTATAGVDYAGTSGTLNFAANETSKTIDVIVNGDLVPEGNETFFVNLSTPVNASITDNQGLGTINNDDAATFTVNDGGEGSDSTPGDGICDAGGFCTLRAAIQEANTSPSSDNIIFAPGFNTINITGSLPDITTTLAIQSAFRVTVFGDNVNRVFNILSAGNLTLDNLSVQNGRSTIGGGLFNQTGGTVSMTNCDFSGNAASISGGGIRNDGTMTITLSTVSFNSGDVRGAGIFNGPAGTLTITDTTVSFNDNDAASAIGGGGISNDGQLTVNRSLVRANITSGNGGGVFSLGGTVNLTNSSVGFNSAFAGNGGGIFNSGGILNLSNSTIAGGNFAVLGAGIFNDIGSTANVRSSIIAGNDATGTAPNGEDVFGAFASPSFNLIGISDGSTGFVNGVNSNIVGTAAAPVDARLAPLDNYGGPTLIFALQLDSPALDKGFAFGETTEQRGFGRTFDDPNIAPAVGGDNTDIGAYERLSPTAANVSLSGRITTANGRGIRGVSVTLTGGNGPEKRVVVTGQFGYYNFSDVESGESYVLSVRSKRYTFAVPSRVVTLNDALSDVDFTALP